MIAVNDIGDHDLKKQIRYELNACFFVFYTESKQYLYLMTENKISNFKTSSRGINIWQKVRYKLNNQQNR